MLEKYNEKALKKDYLTKKQASELLKVSERTINRYIANGNVKTIIVKGFRYIEKKSLEKYLEELYTK